MFLMPFKELAVYRVEEGLAGPLSMETVAQLGQDSTAWSHWKVLLRELSASDLKSLFLK